MLTYTDFIVFHPVFITDDLEVQGKITRMLTNLDECFPLDYWTTDTKREQALMLFVCHLLTVESIRDTAESSGTSKGAIKKIDIYKKVATEYYQSGSLDFESDLLNQTACGRELKAMDEGMFSFSSFVIGPGVC